MNIYEIIEAYGFPMFGNEELGTLITWNGSNTFLWWNRDYSVGNWDNSDIRTNYDPMTIQEAEAEAKRWFAQEVEALDEALDA
jgi:hypothetical protein